ncbi:cysteine hydrolase family protein [Shewanella salipaludis]|uniref:cysteine hydrolase family protein n=1 Tax=Shewanella salipaludis TaxID=2723052 RepID=UPI001B7CFDAC|nr:cysteine hydrolase family protein [Shewanella salipaludis]
MENIPVPKSALLIVDMQHGLFHGLERPFAGQRVLGNINRLIARARSRGVPILAARHTGPQGSALAAGSRNWHLLSELELDATKDILFDKRQPSCFQGTGLADRLKTLGVTELVIAGMKTQYCVDTSCRIAAELGFSPTLVADAHTCMDTPLLAAEAIIAHHNSTLAGPFVRLLNTVEVTF